MKSTSLIIGIAIGIVLAMLLIATVKGCSGPDYPTMSTKEFLFNNQNLLISIDGGPKLDKTLTTDQIATYCSNAVNRLLTIYWKQTTDSHSVMSEFLLTKQYQRIADTDFFVKAESGG